MQIERFEANLIIAAVEARVIRQPKMRRSLSVPRVTTARIAVGLALIEAIGIVWIWLAFR